MIPGLFGFYGMADNYEDRKIGRYEEGDDFAISTAVVTDSPIPYETAVAHPDYNGGKFIIVETYTTLKAAKKGHKRWVKKMTTEPLPETLTDVSQSGIACLYRSMGGSDLTFVRRVK